MILVASLIAGPIWSKAIYSPWETMILSMGLICVAVSLFLIIIFVVPPKMIRDPLS